MWFDTQALDAATCYTDLFPNSVIGSVTRYPAGHPERSEDDVLTVGFTLFGQQFVALNGAPRSRTPKLCPSWSPATRTKNWIPCGIRSSQTVERRVDADGVAIALVCHGRSFRVICQNCSPLERGRRSNP